MSETGSRAAGPSRRSTHQDSTIEAMIGATRETSTSCTPLRCSCQNTVPPAAALSPVPTAIAWSACPEVKATRGRTASAPVARPAEANEILRDAGASTSSGAATNRGRTPRRRAIGSARPAGPSCGRRSSGQAGPAPARMRSVRGLPPAPPFRPPANPRASACANRNVRATTRGVSNAVAPCAFRPSRPRSPAAASPPHRCTPRPSRAPRPSSGARTSPGR